VINPLTNPSGYAIIDLSREREKKQKMARQKNLYLVLDTETCNSVEEPIPYDIGWAICDKFGNILVKRSFVVAEVFLDMKEVMQSAYYAEKIPQYWEDIKQGKRELKGLWNIRKIMREDIRNFKIRRVAAYNMGFDKRALNNLIRYVSKSFCRWWFPFGIEFVCIWHCACQVLLNRKTYIEFAEKNGLISDCGNIKTSAESAYKYITKNLDFVESHTGLEDVEIEIEILRECFKQHKRMNKKINSACWRIVQNKRKEIEGN
jgi:hypothetical protein